MHMRQIVVGIALRILTPLLACLLGACATPGSDTFREGMKNMSQGLFEQGLEQLERASKDAPGNVEYRATFARQREIAVNQLLTQAEAMRVNNNSEQAASIYERVLRIDPGNARARQGLNEIVAEKRHRVLVGEAEA